MINYELTLPNAQVPRKSGPDEAGFDLFCPSEVVIDSSEVKVINLGIRIALPKGSVALLRGRSGLATRGLDPVEWVALDPSGTMVRILGGVIDCTYRGNWGVIIKNLGSGVITLSTGDRCCQFVHLPLWVEEKWVPAGLDVTERGESGLGK